MSSIKTVAVVGASGNIGAPTVKLLHEVGFEVTAITRADSSSTFPDYVKVKPVDYTSIPDLTDAFTGIDAVVASVGYFALDIQPNLIEAAAKAGVSRFIPAEFGADLLNEKTRKFPILASKIQVQELLKLKAKETGMTYSLVFTSLFLDWGLDNGMVVNVKEGKAKLYDGGDRVVSFTTTTTVAKGIVGCLQHLEETKNRGIYVHDIATSQNHIIELAKQVQPEKEWETETEDTAAMEKQAQEAFLRKDYANMIGSVSVIISNSDRWFQAVVVLLTDISQVFRMYFGGEEYGQPFRELDNELFGIKTMKDEELTGLIARITKG
jgi:nucleoside-diphosphate-sugar epimerase